MDSYGDNPSPDKSIDNSDIMESTSADPESPKKQMPLTKLKDSDVTEAERSDVENPSIEGCSPDCVKGEIEVNRKSDEQKLEGFAGDVPPSDVPELLTPGSPGFNEKKARGAISKKPWSSAPATMGDEGPSNSGDVRASVSAHEHESLVDIRRKRYDGSSPKKVTTTPFDELQKDTKGNVDAKKDASNEGEKSEAGYDTVTEELDRQEDRDDKERYESECCCTEMSCNKFHFPGFSSSIFDSQIDPDSKPTLVDITLRVTEALDRSENVTHQLQSAQDSDDFPPGDDSTIATNQSKLRNGRRKWKLASEESSFKDYGCIPEKKRKFGPDWLRKFEECYAKEEEEETSDQEPLDLEHSGNVSGSPATSETDSDHCKDPGPSFADDQEADELAAEVRDLHLDSTAKSGKSLWKKKKFTGKETKIKRPEKRNVRHSNGPPPPLDEEDVKTTNDVIVMLIDDVTKLYRDLVSHKIAMFQRDFLHGDGALTDRSLDAFTPSDAKPDERPDEVEDTVAPDNMSDMTSIFSKLTTSGDNEDDHTMQKLCASKKEYEELQDLLDEFTKNCGKFSNAAENEAEDDTLSSTSESSEDNGEPEEEEVPMISGNGRDAPVPFVVRSANANGPNYSILTSKNGADNILNGHGITESARNNDHGDFDHGYVVIEDLLGPGDSVERFPAIRSLDFVNENGNCQENGADVDAPEGGIGDMPSKKEDKKSTETETCQSFPTREGSPNRQLLSPIDLCNGIDMEDSDEDYQDSSSDSFSMERYSSKGDECCRSMVNSYGIPYAHIFQSHGREDGVSSTSADADAGSISPMSFETGSQHKDGSAVSDDFDSMRAGPNSVSDISFDDSASFVGECGEHIDLTGGGGTQRQATGETDIDDSSASATKLDLFETDATVPPCEENVQLAEDDDDDVAERHQPQTTVVITIQVDESDDCVESIVEVPAAEETDIPIPSCTGHEGESEDHAAEKDAD